MMNCIHTLRENYEETMGVIEKTKNIINNLWNNCVGFEIRKNNPQKEFYNVLRRRAIGELEGRNYNVDMDNRKCDCGVWQDHDVPCIDAVAVIKYVYKSNEQYILENLVSKFYQYETIKEMLQWNIIPVSIDALVPDGYTLAPDNEEKISPGRPKKKATICYCSRYGDKEKSPIVCSFCKKMDIINGHVKREN